jgi:hypothetical protein
LLQFCKSDAYGSDSEFGKFNASISAACFHCRSSSMHLTLGDIFYEHPSGLAAHSNLVSLTMFHDAV